MQPGQYLGSSGTQHIENRSSTTPKQLEEKLQDERRSKSPVQARYFDAKLHSLNSREFGNLSRIAGNQEGASSKFLAAGIDVTNPITPTDTIGGVDVLASRAQGKPPSTLNYSKERDESLLLPSELERRFCRGLE